MNTDQSNTSSDAKPVEGEESTGRVDTQARDNALAWQLAERTDWGSVPPEHRP